MSHLRCSRKKNSDDLVVGGEEEVGGGNAMGAGRAEGIATSMRILEVSTLLLRRALRERGSGIPAELKTVESCGGRG